MIGISLHLRYVYVARMLDGKALAVGRERIRRIPSDRLSDPLRAPRPIGANGIDSPVVRRPAVEKDVPAIRGPDRRFVRTTAKREAGRDIALQISYPNIHVHSCRELVQEPLAVGRE